MLLGVAVPLTFRYIGSYTVTEDDILKGNGSLCINNIDMLVLHKDRIDVYYIDTNKKKIKIENYFPKDKEAFINTLKEINPKIRIV